MKIGILTLHQADSYGAQLQAYALQQTLKTLGADSEFISLPSIPKRILGTRFLKYPKGETLVKVIQREGERRSALFEEFREKYLQCSIPYSFEDGKQINDAYDFFIVGSDQVWNPDLPDVDSRYLLPFADDRKKYSYAASFGSNEISEKLRNFAGNSLQSFRRLSVREESGKKLLKELTGRDSETHIDPVFLPDISLWKNLAQPASPGKYLLIFMLFDDMPMLQYAADYAKANQLELRRVSGGSIRMGFDTWRTSIPQWIGLMRDAAAIVTNSFHGVAFSLLFEKRFCFFPITTAAASRNNRIQHLLTTLKVKENHLQNIPDEPEPVDEILKNIEEKKTCSFEYLRAIIEENQNV